MSECTGGAQHHLWVPDGGPHAVCCDLCGTEGTVIETAEEESSYDYPR